MSDDLVTRLLNDLRACEKEGRTMLITERTAAPLADEIARLRAERDALRALLHRAYPYIEDATYDGNEMILAKRTLLADIDAALREGK